MYPNIRRYKRRARDMRRENIEKENKGGILLAVATRLMKRLCQIVKKDGYGYGGECHHFADNSDSPLISSEDKCFWQGWSVRLSGLSSPPEGRNA